MRIVNRTAVIAAMVFATFAGGVSRACDVPVFKYALERWPADPYRVKIFSGADKTSAKKVLAYLKPFQDDYGALHIESNGKPVSGLPRFPKTSKRPSLAVGYPVQARIDTLACSAPLTLSAARRVVDSPARRAIAKRLLEGAATVFVQVDGSDGKENAAMFERLKKDLVALESQIDSEAAEAAVGLPPDRKPPKITFAATRVSRDDPEEKYFLQMLFNIDSTLPKDKPVVFPIYGRGRVLLALSGKGINKDNLLDICSFITGECSCEVKAMNPGYDLLMAVKWDDYIYEDIKVDDALPPLTALSAAVETVVAASPDNGNHHDAAVPSGKKPSGAVGDDVLLPNLLLTVAIVMVLGAAMAWRGAHARRKRGDETE